MSFPSVRPELISIGLPRLLRARLHARCTGQEVPPGSGVKWKASEYASLCWHPQTLQKLQVNPSMAWASSFSHLIPEASQKYVQNPCYVPFTANCTCELGNASRWWHICLLAFMASQLNALISSSQVQASMACCTCPFLLSKQPYLVGGALFSRVFASTKCQGLIVHKG